MRFLHIAMVTLLATMLWGGIANAFTMTWSEKHQLASPDECLKAQKEGQVLWEQQVNNISRGWYRLGVYLYQHEFQIRGMKTQLFCYRQKAN